MTPGVHTLVIPVRDLPRAKELYARLAGTAPTTDQPYYVGFTLDGQEIGLDPHGHARGMTGPVAYWSVPDVAAALEQLLAAGAETVQPSTDVGGGQLIATARDADGNLIGLRQA